MTALDRAEQQLRRGDVDAVLLFADHERAIAEASRLLAADAATRTEFNNNERVLGSYLASVAAPHVARARRRAELGAEADIERRAAVARLSSGGDEWVGDLQVARTLGVGGGAVSDPRGVAAVERAGVRRRVGVDGPEWNLADARVARIRGAELLRAANLIECWC